MLIVNLSQTTGLFLYTRKRFSENLKEIVFFFYQGFSTYTNDSQDSRGREGTFFYSTLPLPSAHEHSDIYLQFCKWDDLWLVFDHSTCVYQTFTRWDLPPYWITIWLIDWWCNFCLFTWWFDSWYFVTAIWHGKPVDLNSITLVLQANRLTKCTNHPRMG